MLCKCTCAASRACWTLNFEWGHSVLPCCHLPQHPRVPRPCRDPAQVAASLFSSCCLPREPVCWSREPFDSRQEEWLWDRGMLLSWGSCSPWELSARAGCASLCRAVCPLTKQNHMHASCRDESGSGSFSLPQVSSWSRAGARGHAQSCLCPVPCLPGGSDCWGSPFWR